MTFYRVVEHNYESSSVDSYWIRKWEAEARKDDLNQRGIQMRQRYTIWFEVEQCETEDSIVNDTPSTSRAD